MRNLLFGVCLTLALGSTWESLAQRPGRPPASVAAVPALLGTWTLAGTSWVQTTHKGKGTSVVTASETRCNVCPDVLFLANGRGAILSEGSPDTLSQFRWQLDQQVLKLQVEGPDIAGSAALPTGSYRLRPAARKGPMRRIDLLDKQGVAYELTAAP
jgi:hypothetical protein